MSNAIEVNKLVARNALAKMHNKLQFFKLVDRQLDSQWSNNTNGYAPGESYQINRPARFKTNEGNLLGAFDAASGTWVTQDFIEDPITFTINVTDQRNGGVQFNSKEKTLALVDEKSKLGEGMGSQLATDLEKKVVAETIVKGGGYILAAGKGDLKIATTDLLKAQARLDSLACPTDMRSVLIPPVAMADLSSESLNLFTPIANEKIGVTGYVSNFAGADMFSYNLLPTLVVPAIGTALVVQANVADGASAVSVTVDSGDNGKVLKAGSIIEFDSYSMVNPETRESIGAKYSFALKSDVTLATGTVSLPFDEAAKIYGPDDSGNRQNVDSLPLAASALTVVGAGKSFYQVVMFQESAYTATVIPLTTDLPGASAARADHDGFSVRTSVQTVIGSDSVVHRFDAMAKGILQRDTYAVKILVEI